MKHIHTYHVAVMLYATAQLIFNLKYSEFIKTCLSEGNTGSSMRLSGYMFVQLICVCELYHTVKIGSFDTTHLLYLLIAVGAMYGIIKAAQVLAFKNGTKVPDDTVVTATVTTDTNIAVKT